MNTDFRRASTTALLPQIAVPVYPDGAMNVLHRMAPVRALTATSLPRNEQHGTSSLPSRPGEFHPEPLTDPDLTLSRHPARATERRLPPPVENWSSSCCQLAHSQRR